MHPITRSAGPVVSNVRQIPSQYIGHARGGEAVQLWLPLIVEGSAIPMMVIGQLVTMGLGVLVKMGFLCPRCTYDWDESVTLWNAYLHPDRHTLNDLPDFCPCCGSDGSQDRMLREIQEQFFIDPEVLLGGPF